MGALNAGGGVTSAGGGVTGALDIGGGVGVASGGGVVGISKGGRLSLDNTDDTGVHRRGDGDHNPGSVFSLILGRFGVIPRGPFGPGVGGLGGRVLFLFFALFLIYFILTTRAGGEEEEDARRPLLPLLLVLRRFWPAADCDDVDGLRRRLTTSSGDCGER